MDLDQLYVLQKELKSLAKIDYERYRKQIVDTGYAFPIKAWKSPEGMWQIVGGTQCYRTLKQMRDVEGYTIPLLPVTVIEADDLRQACHRVMQDASSYGKMEDQGLYEFMQMASISAEDLKANFRTPEINMDQFEAEFFQLEKEAAEIEEGLDLNMRKLIEIECATEEEQQLLFEELKERGLTVKILSI